MRAVATHFPILLICIGMKSGASEQLLHQEAPFRKRRPEPTDKEDKVMPRRDSFLEQAVCFPRDPFLPVSPDRAIASPGNHHGKPVGRGAVAIMQELQAASVYPSPRPEKPFDVFAGAESFVPSKASSHLRR